MEHGGALEGPIKHEWLGPALRPALPSPLDDAETADYCPGDGAPPGQALHLAAIQISEYIGIQGVCTQQGIILQCWFEFKLSWKSSFEVVGTRSAAAPAHMPPSIEAARHS